MEDTTIISPGTSPSLNATSDWLTQDEEMYVIKRNGKFFL